MPDIWYCCRCGHDFKHENELMTRQFEKGKEKTVSEQRRVTCNPAIRCSCIVASAVSSASRSRLAAANSKSQCSHQSWKPSLSDIALDIACVAGLMTGPLAFNEDSVLISNHFFLERLATTIPIISTSQVSSGSLRVALGLAWGVAVSVYFQHHKKDRYQDHWLLATIVSSCLCNWFLSHNTLEVLMVGLPWGVSVGLLSSSLVHRCSKWWWRGGSA